MHVSNFDKMEAENLNLSSSKRRRLNSDLMVQFTRDLWQESLDDCSGDEVQAKKQYERIMESIAGQRRRREQQQLVKESARAGEHVQASASRTDSCSDDTDSVAESDTDVSSSSSSEESDNPDQQCVANLKQLRISRKPQSRHGSSKSSRSTRSLQWLKPGTVAARVGVSQSVLRNWAKAKVVQTMLSPGGHRLFNVKSVEHYIKTAAADDNVSLAAAAVAADSKSASTSHCGSDGDHRLLVYCHLDCTNLEKAQIQGIGEQIKTRVMKQYENGFTTEELQSTLVIVELHSDTERAADEQCLSPPRITQFFNTPGMRRLLQSLCNPKQRAFGSSLKVVLQRAEDISTSPSTYAFFLMLCRSMGATVDIVPELFTNGRPT